VHALLIAITSIDVQKAEIAPGDNWFPARCNKDLAGVDEAFNGSKNRLPGIAGESPERLSSSGKGRRDSPSLREIENARVRLNIKQTSELCGVFECLQIYDRCDDRSSVRGRDKYLSRSG